MPLQLRRTATQVCLAYKITLQQFSETPVCYVTIDIGLLRGTVVERRSVTGELPCSTLDLQLMGDHLPGQTVCCKVSQLGQLSLSSFQGQQMISEL